MSHVNSPFHPWLFPLGPELAILFLVAWRHGPLTHSARLVHALEQMDVDALQKWVSLRMPRKLNQVSCLRHSPGDFWQCRGTDDGRNALPLFEAESLVRAAREFSLLNQPERLVWEVASAEPELAIRLTAAGPAHAPILRITSPVIAQGVDDREWRGVSPLTVARLLGPSRERPLRRFATLAADLAAVTGSELDLEVSVPAPAGAPEGACDALQAAIESELESGRKIAASQRRRRTRFLVVERLDAENPSRSPLTFRKVDDAPLEVRWNLFMNGWLAPTWGQFRVLCPGWEEEAMKIHLTIRYETAFFDWALETDLPDFDKQWENLLAGKNVKGFPVDRTPPCDDEPFEVGRHWQWHERCPSLLSKATSVLPGDVEGRFAGCLADHQGMMSIASRNGDETVISQANLRPLAGFLARRGYALLRGPDDQDLGHDDPKTGNFAWSGRLSRRNSHWVEAIQGGTARTNLDEV